MAVVFIILVCKKQFQWRNEKKGRTNANNSFQKMPHLSLWYLLLLLLMLMRLHNSKLFYLLYFFSDIFLLFHRIFCADIIVVFSFFLFQFSARLAKCLFQFLYKYSLVLLAFWRYLFQFFIKSFSLYQTGYVEHTLDCNALLKLCSLEWNTKKKN